MPVVDPWIGPRGTAARRVLRIMRAHGPMTRPDLARLTGLSVSGVRPLVASLLADGLLREQPEEPDGTRGRPGRVLVPVVPEGRVVGVDFGHAHVSVAVGDLTGARLRHERRELDVDDRAEDALACAGELFAAVRDDLPVARVVAGLPGPVDRGGRLRSSTIAASWWEVPAAERIGQALGVAADVVDVENDAQLGARGEFGEGAGAGCEDGVYVKASHGLGAGLVLHGGLYRGAEGLTGEIGHAVVQPDGELCRCGGRGCLETVVSVERVRERIRFVVGGEEPVDLAAVAHHAAVRRIVSDAGRALGRALADVCNLLNPQVIVLGGELAAAGDALLDGVSESIGRYGQPAVADTRVVLGALGPDAELAGAVRLAAERARETVWGRI